MKAIFVPAFMVGTLLVLLSGCSGNSQNPEQSTQDDGFNEVTAIEMTLRWRVTGETLEVELESPATGWVAVGFDPSSMMQDANFILAYVKDGEVSARDDFGTWLTSHQSDESLGGTMDVSDLSGDETDDGTTVRFTIPLDSGDEYDRPLRSGETYTVLMAYSEADDFQTVHRDKTSVEIEL